MLGELALSILLRSKDRQPRGESWAFRDQTLLTAWLDPVHYRHVPSRVARTEPTADPMPKITASKPPIAWKQFVLFWWQEAPGNRLGSYRTREPRDIAVFTENHFRIHFHPDSSDDALCEVILRRTGKTWYLKLDDSEEFWTYYDEDADNSIWTWMDDANQELFTIRGELKS